MRVYSPDFVYIYRVSGFLSSQEVKLYIGTGVLTLVLDTSDDAAYYMRKNGWIVMDDGEPYIIKHIVQGLEQITVTAYGCHKLLEQRITGGGALKNVTISKTGSADAVAKHFIDQCKGDLPLVTAPTHSGSTISDQTRLNGLGDEIGRILGGAGRGERYTFDADNKRIIFDTYQGTDRTYGNAEDNPPVVFALKFKNIQDLTYTESATDEQTTIYVGGAGEGSDREVIVVGNDKTGLDRVERFRDARDVKEGEADKLTERGNQLVIGTQETISTTAISDAGLVYGVDYNLGDIVTTQVTQKTYTEDGDYFNPTEVVREVNQRITEVAITREGGAEDIDLRFGDEPITATQTQSMARQVAQLKAVEPGGFLPLDGSKPMTGALEIANAVGGSFNLGLNDLGNPFLGVSESGVEQWKMELKNGIVPLANGGLGTSNIHTARANLGMGETLFQGSWGSGTLTVPGIRNYSIFMVVLEEWATGVLTVLYNNIFRGVGNTQDPAGTQNIMGVAAKLNTNTDTLTYEVSGRTIHTMSGNHTYFGKMPVVLIRGLI